MQYVKGHKKSKPQEFYCAATQWDIRKTCQFAVFALHKDKPVFH